MKAEAMRAKSADELKEMIMDLRKEQMTLRFQASSQQLQQTSQVRVIRRSIARAKTLLNEQTQGQTKIVKTPKAAKPAAEKKTAKAPAAKKAAKAKA